MKKFALMFLIGLIIVPFVYAECTDSDGGKDYYVKGETTYNGQTLYDECDGTYLEERWCENDERKGELYECPNGCKDGVCINCDSHKISITEVLNKDGKIAVNYKTVGAEDKVKAELIIATQAIPPSGGGGGSRSATGNVVGTETPASSGGGGSAGTISCPITSGTCDASSGGDFISCTVYTECDYPEFKQNTDYWIKLIDKNCPDVYDTLVIKPIAKCTDSDDGRNFHVKGKTCVGDNCKPDVCTDDTHLSEYYCQSENDRGDVWIICPNGCKDGACVKEIQKCTDSDDGKDYYVKGSCSLVTTTAYVGGVSSVLDFCLDDKTLKECYCDNNDLKSIEYKCSNGCRDGVCIKEIECPVEHVLCEGGSVPQSYIGDDGCEHWKCVPVDNRCWSDKDCSTNQFCEFSPCTAQIGKCVDIPEVCAEIYSPVCGCDGKTYGNDCERKAAKVSKDYDGKCIEQPPQGIYVKLGEKFSLREGGEAKVTDYSYMKIKLYRIVTLCTEPGGCKDKAHIIVTMPQITAKLLGKVTEPTAIQVSTDDTTTSIAIPSTELTLHAGESKEVFGAKITFLGTTSSTDASNSRSGMFIVEKSIVSDLVDIEIYPVEQDINYGDKAVYKVKVTDKHPAPRCATGARCIVKPLIYNIKIRNLPFLKKYPREIEVPYGGTKVFELIVLPYQAVKTEVKEATMEKAVAVTGQVVAKPTVRQGYLIKTPQKSSITGKATTTTQPTIKPTVATLIRHYKFSVTAVQQDKPSVQDTASALLIIKPEQPPVPPPVPPPLPGEKISLKLEKGWNLISLPGKLVRFDEKSIGRKKLIGFIYIKEKQKYYTLQEAEKILGPDIREYLARNAFWIYSKSPMTLNIWINREISLQDIDLVSGWNPVPITEDMVGGYLTDIIGDCDIEKIYLWDAVNQKWIKIDTQYSFDTSKLGYGFLMKSKNYCRLSGPTILPPPMPE